MPKNYRALTKLRKQQFERVEQELAVVNGKLQKLLAQKEALRADERAMEIPTAGMGRALGAILNQKRAIQSELERLQEQIELTQQHKYVLEASLKEAHIAYEQAKSIESQVIQRVIMKQKRAEQGLLDEIASQRFWRDRNGEKKEQM